MATTERVRIEGLKEVKKALRGMLPDRQARAVMFRVLTSRAKPIAEDMRQMAPVDSNGDETLKRSIVVSRKLTKRQRGRRRKVSNSDIEVFVGPSNKETPAVFHYAHLQEFGAPQHAPQPFLRPAWDKARSTLFKDIAAEMWKEIKKSIDRAAKKAAKGK